MTAALAAQDYKGKARLLGVVLDQDGKPLEGVKVTVFLPEANELFDKNDYQGALAAFQAMVQKYPEAYILWKNVGNCYFVLEQYDKAEEAYHKIVEKAPQVRSFLEYLKKK